MISSLLGHDRSEATALVSHFRVRAVLCSTIPKAVTSVADFTSDVIVNVSATVVNLAEGLSGDDAFSVKLPSNVAGRHRICQKLGQKIKAMGFSGDAGYNQFLYPNERDTRKLLMFLVEKIPKSQEEEVEEVLGADALRNRAIVERLGTWAATGWAPAHCAKFRPSGARVRRFARRSLRTTPLSISDPRSRDPARKRYCESYLSMVTAQPPTRDGVAPSLVERNDSSVTEAAEREAELVAAGADDPAEYRRRQRKAMADMLRAAFAGAAEQAAAAASARSALSDVMGDLKAGAGKGGERGTAFTHQTEFGQEQASTAGAAAAAAGVEADDGESEEARKARTEAALEEARQKELAELQARIDAATAFGTRAASAKEQGTAKLRQAAAALAAEKGKTGELEKAFLVKKQTLEMLPEAARHIAELQRICGESAAKLVRLAAEWETHRRPLVDSIRQHKESKSHRKEEAKRKVEEMKRMRAEMKSMAGEIRAKEERAKHLAHEYEQMPKDINRALYTHRIMDIIKQNRKQKVEITKIISHIREVQREINMATDKLTRTEAITDERVYQEAAARSSDEAYVNLYRSLKDLREVFDTLIETTQQAAHAENAANDAESRTKQLEQRSTATNMERIAADLKQVKAENEAITKQLRAARGGAGGR